MVNVKVLFIINLILYMHHPREDLHSPKPGRRTRSSRRRGEIIQTSMCCSRGHALLQKSMLIDHKWREGSIIAN